MANGLAEHALSGEKGELIWREGDDTVGLPEQVTVTFTDEDIAALDASIKEFFSSGLPKLVRDISADAVRGLVSKLKSDWPAHYDYEKARLAMFEHNLEARWGKALDLLRVILTTSREIGGETVTRFKRSRARSRRQCQEVLLLLHGRACQVTAEIITLLEHGYADGAMARWRTLREIEIVALVIADGGDDVAEQYVAYQAIEDKKEMREYEQSPSATCPIARRDKRLIDKAYSAAIKRFGPAFGKRNGWAARYLNRNDVTLRDLEEAAGRASGRMHYMMASHNIHAGPKGVFFRLGHPDTSIALLAGASNAGLDEAGAKAAHSLTCITGLVFPSKLTLDDIIILETLLTLRDQAIRAFERIGRKLIREHRRKMKKGRSRRKA